MDRSEIFHISLNFAAVRGKKLETTKSPGPNRANDDVYLFYFETLRLEIWPACLVKPLLYFMNSAAFTYYTTC